MSEEHDHDAADGHDHEQSDGRNEGRERITSPMQDYSTGQVTTGFVVLLVGIAVAYALPALF